MYNVGEFHDQADAKWIVIRTSLWGHNDTPCRLPSPGRPIGHPGSGHPEGVIGVFQLLLISIANFFHCPPDHGIHSYRPPKPGIHISSLNPAPVKDGAYLIDADPGPCFMGGPWAVHGRSMGGPWAVHGRSMGGPKTEMLNFCGAGRPQGIEYQLQVPTGHKVLWVLATPCRTPLDLP
jgi:hypothetical protein